MSFIRTTKIPMMANTNDKSFVNEIWYILFPRFQDIFQGLQMTRADFIVLYTSVYNYSTHIKRVIAANPDDNNESRMKVAMRMRGWELYKKIREFLTEHHKTILTQANNLQGPDFLIFYTSR